MRILLVLVTVAATSILACSSDDTAPMPDASTGSGSGSGAACTGKLYDACNPNASNCMSPYVCKDYGTSGFSVCVPPQGDCTANGCPDQSGAQVTCNGMGFCKPAAPNADCTAP
jgi:hypothetical protein